MWYLSMLGLQLNYVSKRGYRWCNYASIIWVIIGSGNGLSPVWCQAIAWSNDASQVHQTANKGKRNFNQNTNIFIHNIPFQNVICKVSTIFYSPQCTMKCVCLCAGFMRCIGQHSWWLQICRCLAASCVILIGLWTTSRWDGDAWM